MHYACGQIRLRCGGNRDLEAAARSMEPADPNRKKAANGDPRVLPAPAIPACWGPANDAELPLMMRSCRSSVQAWNRSLRLPLPMASLSPSGPLQTAHREAALPVRHTGRVRIGPSADRRLRFISLCHCDCFGSGNKNNRHSGRTKLADSRRADLTLIVHYSRDPHG